MPGLVRFTSARFGLVWFGSIRFGLVWFGSVWWNSSETLSGSACYSNLALIVAYSSYKPIHTRTRTHFAPLHWLSNIY